MSSKETESEASVPTPGAGAKNVVVPRRRLKNHYRRYRRGGGNLGLRAWAERIFGRDADRAALVQTWLRNKG